MISFRSLCLAGKRCVRLAPRSAAALRSLSRASEDQGTAEVDADTFRILVDEVTEMFQQLERMKAERPEDVGEDLERNVQELGSMLLGEIAKSSGPGASELVGKLTDLGLAVPPADEGGAGEGDADAFEEGADVEDGVGHEEQEPEEAQAGADFVPHPSPSFGSDDFFEDPYDDDSDWWRPPTGPTSREARRELALAEELSRMGPPPNATLSDRSGQDSQLMARGSTMIQKGLLAQDVQPDQQPSAGPAQGRGRGRGRLTSEGASNDLFGALSPESNADTYKDLPAYFFEDASEEANASILRLLHDVHIGKGVESYVAGVKAAQFALTPVEPSLAEDHPHFEAVNKMCRTIEKNPHLDAEYKQELVAMYEEELANPTEELDEWGQEPYTDRDILPNAKTLDAGPAPDE